MVKIKGNPNPKIGKKPIVVQMNRRPESALLDKLVSQREQSGAPVLHETDLQYDFTVGQLKLMEMHNLSVVMTDDLGKYELAVGPELRVIKRRL